MTISAYTGLPGHGKSYGVVENVIAPALKANREVFTNIPMNLDVCLKRYGMAPVQFDIQDIVDNPNWWTEVFTPGSLLVIDELWRLWPNGLNASKVRSQDKSFLAEHRHMVGENGQSVEVVLVTQDLSQIAQFARSLVETTFRVTKLSAMGLDNRYRVDVYFGPVTGVTPPVSKRQREIQGKFKKDTYELYKSHTKSVTGGAGNESRVDGRFNALGKLSVKLGILLFFVALFVFYYGLKSVMAYYGSFDDQDSTSVTHESSTPEVLQPAQVKTVFRFLSKAEGVWITGRLNTVNLGRIQEEYLFEVKFDDSVVHLNQLELGRLGYEVNYINDCMVIVKGDDFDGYALCHRQEFEPGLIERMVTSPGSEQT